MGIHSGEDGLKNFSSLLCSDLGPSGIKLPELLMGHWLHAPMSMFLIFLGERGVQEMDQKD